MDLSRITPYNEPISGPCFDDLHDVCEWPSEPQYVLYCSCFCHKEARAVANPRTTTSRKPRETTPRASAARARVENPAEEVTAADAQEIEAEGHYVTAELCGEELRIIPPGAWRQSWHRLLNAGQFDDFANLVLHPDDVEMYFDIDPTNNEFSEFVTDAANQSGEGLGKSHGPAPSSRRTRRR